MPNRILYASLLDSEKVNQLSPDAFELYIRLLLVADDFGRYSGSPIKIARTCWPSREDMTSKTVDPLLRKLAKVGLVVQYMANGDPILQLTNWNQRTRANDSKYPPPDDRPQDNDSQMTVTCQSNDGPPLTETETETETYIGDGDVYKHRAASSSPPIVNLPLIDGTDYPVDQEQVDKWQGLYQAVDVPAELRKMIGWLDSNPKNRKTKTGIQRFVTNWLSRQQDSARASPRQQPAKKSNMGNFTQRSYEPEFFDEFIQKV